MAKVRNLGPSLFTVHRSPFGVRRSAFTGGGRTLVTLPGQDIGNTRNCFSSSFYGITIISVIGDLFPQIDGS